MRINHNIPALQSLFQYNKTNSALEKSLEKLSSGKRINRAADDAAGLAISNKLDAQIRGLEQANRNSNDGISLIQTAEGALNEVEAMLQRMRELAVQASNGTLATEDREAVQKEIDQLAEEINRVSNDMEFNEMKLLNGDLDRVTFSSDKDIADVVTLSDTVKPGSYSFDVVGASKAQVVGSGITNSLFTAGKVTAATAGTLNINGTEIVIEENDTPEKVLDKLNQAGDVANFTVTPSATPLADTVTLTITNDAYGNDPISISGDTQILTALGLSSPTSSSNGSDVVVSNFSTTFPSGISPIYKDNVVELRGPDGFKFVIENNGVPPTASSVTIDILETGPLDIQIGANEGQSMEVRIPNMSPEALGIDNLNVHTAENANEALGAVDAAINTVSLVRAQLGAYQNRLEYTINNLSTATENMTASLSRIVDVDMAVEMANFTQLNVISQSGVSMIAQANQMPEQVLQLLRG